MKRLGHLDNFVLNHILFKRLNHFSYKISLGGNSAFFPLVLILIFLPTIYERKWFSLSFIFESLSKGNIRSIVAAYVHVLRRVIYFFKLFFRRYFKDDIQPNFFNESEKI